MKSLRSIVDLLKRRKHLAVKPAYRLWAAEYDNQPDNLTLRLENEIFTSLLQKITLTGKRVVDIGCGTGRHWNQLYEVHPSQLIGVDVSQEMLNRLQEKYPGAEVFCSADHHLPMINDESADVIISTLTIGHIENLSDVLDEWNRIMKPGGALLVTDFHPEGFRKGMTRTFTHNNSTIDVENYYHPVERIKSFCERNHIHIETIEERSITEDVRHVFERAGNMHDYERFLGTPLILGFVARKEG